MRRITMFLLVIMIAGSLFSQDRSGTVSQFRNLKAAPGSHISEILPPDGRPWIIFIFKACCTPADQAARWIVKATHQYGDSLGVIGLNVDRTRSMQRVKGWLKSHDITFPVYSDPTSQVSISWGVYAPPAVVILDREGVEVYRTMGYMSTYAETLDQKLDELLHPTLQDSTGLEP